MIVVVIYVAGWGRNLIFFADHHCLVSLQSLKSGNAGRTYNSNPRASPWNSHNGNTDETRLEMKASYIEPCLVPKDMLPNPNSRNYFGLNLYKYSQCLSSNLFGLQIYLHTHTYISTNYVDQFQEEVLSDTYTEDFLLSYDASQASILLIVMGMCWRDSARGSKS